MSKFRRYMRDILESEARRQERANVSRIRGLPQGEWEAEGVFVIRNRFSFDELLPERPESHEVMRRFGATENLVFLDLETTGLAGGTGTYAFLCGIGRAEDNGFTVTQYFLEGPALEANWLSATESLIPEDVCLVTYNGRTFDLPLLRTRHILSRSSPCWERAPHIDLLQYSRRLYRGRLESCSLSSIERHVLGLVRSGEDVPGSMIPALYAEYLRTGDASSLEGVFSHNSQDIVSLAALYCRVARILCGDTESGLDLLRAGDIWHHCGCLDRADAFWRKAMESPEAASLAHRRIALEAKRSRQYGQAHCEFLLALRAMRNATGSPRRRADLYTTCELLEELAKLEEHRLARLADALDHTAEALALLASKRALLGGEYMQICSRFLARAKRLEQKLAGRKKKGDTT